MPASVLPTSIQNYNLIPSPQLVFNEFVTVCPLVSCSPPQPAITKQAVRKQLTLSISNVYRMHHVPTVRKNTTSCHLQHVVCRWARQDVYLTRGGRIASPSGGLQPTFDIEQIVGPAGHVPRQGWSDLRPNVFRLYSSSATILCHLKRSC